MHTETANDATADQAVPDTIPTDLIPVADVPKLLPSSRAGKRLHVATVHRWIEAGLLRAWKRRGPVKTSRFVSRADVLGMLEPEQTNAKYRKTEYREQVEEKRRREIRVSTTLEEFGLTAFRQKPKPKG